MLRSGLWQRLGFCEDTSFDAHRFAKRQICPAERARRDATDPAADFPRGRHAHHPRAGSAKWRHSGTVLQEENLAHPRPGLLYVLWRSRHPSIAERIEFANQYRPWETGQPLTYSGAFRAP
jgi:hypothetical protein